jgi:hypothetical protein
MAEQIIQNPSITPGALKIELSGGYVTAISGHPVGGTGGGGPSVVYTGVVGEITVDNQQGTIGIADEIKNTINSKASKVELNTTYNTLNEAKQDKLTFGYDDTAISSINGSAIAGAGGAGDYSAGADLKIVNNIISVDTNGNPNNTASNTRNFVEGSWTVASGYMNHAEGIATSALGYGVHAQGMWTKFSSNDGQLNGGGTGPIYWGAGAGATVEGYCNATTSCPMSGTEEQSDYGPIHGGVLKVIGNGYVENEEHETDGHVPHPSDALIIFKDGTISAFGDIFNNGKKYVTEDAISSYNVTAQQGVEVTPEYDSTNKTITFGISITSTPVVTDTRLSGYNGIAAAKDGNVSGQWNVGLTNDMLNTINGKLDSSVAEETYQSKGNYVSSTDITDMATMTWVGTQGYLTEVPSEYVTDTELQTTLGNYATNTLVQNTSAAITALIPSTAGLASETDLQIVSAGVNAVSGELPNYLKVTAYEADSGKFALKSEIPTVPTKVSDLTDSANYLTTAKYATDSATFVTSSNAVITGTKQYALTTTGWAEVQSGATLTASSGINIDNNLINVTLGRNLKFDTYSSVTTEDNIRVSSVRAGEYDNQYTIVNKDGLEINFSSAPDSAKLTLTTNGLYNSLVGGNRSITADYNLNHLFFKSYDNIGTYSGDYSQVEIKVLQETAPEATQHRSSITLTDYYEGVEHTGLITVEKIAQWDQGGSFTGVTTAGSISGDGLTNPLGLVTSAEQALTSVSNKVDKPTSLNDKYLVLRTDNAGNVSGWEDLKNECYSKTEATGTFVATANIDTTTLSGDGKTTSTKLGVKTDVIATKDYVNSSFLPLSGGTVSGQLVVSGDGTFDQENLKFIRSGQNGYGRIGLASNGALAIKVDDSNSNITQINVAANASYNELIQVQHGGTTAYLIPAVTATTTAGITDDGILHIIIES